MGLRKVRSQHQAIYNLRESCRNLNINWIISADITGLFDNINHELLKDHLKLKINDEGYWVIKKKTVRKRLNRFMKMVWNFCKTNRHEPIREQCGKLCSKLLDFTSIMV
jgi:retron-type reverse transcriptase